MLEKRHDRCSELELCTRGRKAEGKGTVGLRRKRLMKRQVKRSGRVLDGQGCRSRPSLGFRCYESFEVICILPKVGIVALEPGVEYRNHCW